MLADGAEPFISLNVGTPYKFQKLEKVYCEEFCQFTLNGHLQHIIINYVNRKALSYWTDSSVKQWKQDEPLMKMGAIWHILTGTWLLVLKSASPDEIGSHLRHVVFPLRTAGFISFGTDSLLRSHCERCMLYFVHIATILNSEHFTDTYITGSPFSLTCHRPDLVTPN